MTINSKQKGARGEREWARFCKEQGYECRRGQQFCGANGDADVIGLPGIYVEVKRYGIVTHRLIVDSLEQAYNDRKTDDLIIVAHRADNCKWEVSMTADHMGKMLGGSKEHGRHPVTMLAVDWFEIYRKWEGERC